MSSAQTKEYLFEIVSDTTVERLRMIFPTRQARYKVIRQARKDGYEQRIVIQKLTFEIDYLENFKLRYPGYEYEIAFEKVGFFKTKPVSFSVWAAILDREITESQYIFSALREVVTELRTMD